jgi:hypothetical protein
VRSPPLRLSNKKFVSILNLPHAYYMSFPSNIVKGLNNGRISYSRSVRYFLSDVIYICGLYAIPPDGQDSSTRITQVNIRASTLSLYSKVFFIG